MIQDGVAYLPEMRTQPVAARVVAETLADAAEEQEIQNGRITEVAGPQEERLADIAAVLFASRGDSFEIREGRTARRPGRHGLCGRRGAAQPGREARRPQLRRVARGVGHGLSAFLGTRAAGSRRVNRTGFPSSAPDWVNRDCRRRDLAPHWCRMHRRICSERPRRWTGNDEHSQTLRRRLPVGWGPKGRWFKSSRPDQQTRSAEDRSCSPARAAVVRPARRNSRSTPRPRARHGETSSQGAELNQSPRLNPKLGPSRLRATSGGAGNVSPQQFPGCRV